MKWKKDNKLPNTKNVRRKTNPAGVTTTVNPKNQQQNQTQSQNQNQSQDQQHSNQQAQQQAAAAVVAAVTQQQQQGGNQGAHTPGYGHMGSGLMSSGLSPVSAPYPHGAMKPDYGLTTL